MPVRTRQEWVSKLLFIFLLFLHLGSTTDCFKIFRRLPMRPDSQNDSFQTPQPLCGITSKYRCQDYGAQQTTCTSCTCPISSDTFRYTHAQWKCVGKSEIRLETGCSVKVKGELQSKPLLLVRSGHRYYIDLPINQRCYSYQQDIYYRTCNGTWLAAGGMGSRYTLRFFKRQNRYRYFLDINTASQAVNVLQGRIIRLNITCSKTGSSLPWNTCLLFKEPYINKPISCPIYQALKTTTATLVIQTDQSTESTGTSTISPTPTFQVVQTSSVPNVTHYHQADKESQSGVDKKIVISVSATVGAFVVIATVICIVIFCKRRKRKNAAKYTAALYNVPQDQCSAGVYDETNINLPSALKSASLMSHGNPAYGTGQDLSISIKSTRHTSSPSRLQPDEAELVDGSKFIENKSMFTDATAAQPIKGRRNMIVAYENVIVLRQDTPRESVPDAEAFYENPGTYSPHYHVLEDLRDLSSSTSCPSGSYVDQETHEDFHHDSSQEEEDHNSYNDTYPNGDRPVDVNPASPASTAGSMRDGNFSCEEPDANLSYQDDDNAINNPGYMEDDDEEDRNIGPNISADEPIYDNQIDIGGHNKSGAPPYALLRDQPNEGVYEDLKGKRSAPVTATSDYQSLSPVTARKHPKTKLK